MIYAIYIAAAAAVGLLIGFVALSIGWLRKTVSSNIRSKALGLVSVYDELLERKSRELAAMELFPEEAAGSAEAARVPEPAAVAQASETQALRPSELLNMAERSGGAVYRDRTLGSVYLKIRENFSFRLEELLGALEGPQEEGGGPASRLLEELEFDTIYRLSTLSEEEQLEVLREALQPEGAALLETYLQSHASFCALKFYDQLRAWADAEPGGVRLRVPCSVVSGRTVQNGVDIIPDDEICEGFLLENGRFIYDYCIKARELS